MLFYIVLCCSKICKKNLLKTHRVTELLLRPQHVEDRLVHQGDHDLEHGVRAEGALAELVVVGHHCVPVLLVHASNPEIVTFLSLNDPTKFQDSVAQKLKELASDRKTCSIKFMNET